MSDRDNVRTLAIARAAFGGAAVLLPSLVGRGWLGSAAGNGAARTAVRGLGARDFALGLLTIEALEEDRSVRRLVEMGALCDGIDVVASVLAGKDVPKHKRLLTMLVAGAAAVIGLEAAGNLD